MTRRALIISNPGTVDTDGYLRGVQKDVDHYKAFLKSPAGGLWYDSEIVTLYKPEVSACKAAVLSLRSADYSMTIFSGHGYHAAANNSTFVELRHGTTLDSSELRKGAPKHTLILDCCRVVDQPLVVVMDSLAKAMKAEKTIHPADCREYYDENIASCAPGLVVLFACEVGETAGDSASLGGFYSYSLINSAQAWHKKTYVDTSKKYLCLSVVSAHDEAVKEVGVMSGGRQTPSIDKPRTDKHFPFCIIA